MFNIYGKIIMKLNISILTFFIIISTQAWAEEPSVSTIDWASAKEIKSLIRIKLEPQNGEVTYGPNFAYSDETLLKEYSEIYVTRTVDPKDEEAYILYITTHHNDKDWRSYDMVEKKDGAKLELRTLEKNMDVTDNNILYKHEERLAVIMTFIDFADAFDAGLNLTITGSQTTKLEIPGPYFLAMLQSM